MEKKTKVLFMQSQTYFGADSMIHSLLMRYLNRERVEVHAACNPGTTMVRSAAIGILEQIPNLQLRPTMFGPTVNQRSKQAIIWSALRGVVPMLLSMARLVAYIKKHQIDIIHATEKPRDAFYGVLLSRLTGAKCVIHLHVGVGDWMSPLTRWAMKHADGLIGVSAFVAQTITAYGYFPHKTYHILNSLDLAHGWNEQATGTGIRQEFGLAPETPVLAIISRVFPWKGHTELLKALAKVNQSRSDYKLLLVGEDDPRATPGGGSYIAQLRALADELGIADQVIFTGFRKDVANILAACDIFAMPSFEEPFGVVYLEAMAMKKPIIALENGGTLEVVEHLKSGLLSLPYDIDSLADHILMLLNDPALRLQLGEYGRTRCEQYFNPQRMADETEQAYRHILTSPSDRSIAPLSPSPYDTLGSTKADLEPAKAALHH